MKKLITTLMLMGITTICLAQKPMVGFTEYDIKAWRRQLFKDTIVLRCSPKFKNPE
jgi:hypothetical protein